MYYIVFLISFLKSSS